MNHNIPGFHRVFRHGPKHFERQKLQEKCVRAGAQENKGGNAHGPQKHLIRADADGQPFFGVATVTQKTQAPGVFCDENPPDGRRGYLETSVKAETQETAR